MENDLEPASFGTCITITSGGSGSTLDCEGHSIVDKRSDSGITILNASGVAIKNCNVKNFSTGIYLRLSNYNNIINNNVSNNFDGFIIQASNNNVISGNIISSNNNAISTIFGSGNNTLVNNTVSNS